MANSGGLSNRDLAQGVWPEGAANRWRVQPEICFFARVKSPQILERVEFYAVDIELLKSVSDSVRTTTRVRDLRPAKLYFVWWWTWAIFPIVLAKILSRPVVVVGVLGLTEYEQRPWIEKKLINAAFFLADINVFASKMEFETVPQRIHVNNPRLSLLAIDCDVYAEGTKPREENSIASVSWLSYGNAVRKGVPELIRAFALLRKKVPNVCLRIAGERGKGFDRILRITQECGVEDAVEFMGAISRVEKIRLLQTCTVYVQPSHFEGFGLAILEAMSCGAPVVTSLRGAIPEVVGDAAEIIEPEDIDGIASTLHRLFADPAARAKLGDRGARRAREWFGRDRREKELRSFITDLRVHESRR
jgi:glycosyltransferase involved in cell wall biosynthesis